VLRYPTLVIVLGSILASALAADTSDSEIVVVVEGGKSAKGALIISVFGSSESFSKEAIFWRTVEPDPSGRTEIVFDRAEFPSEFAISLYHDINDNEKLDTGFMRIPKEPYGFSNNPGFRMGPPRYEPSVLVKDEIDGDIVIRLK
jgi:uncharacterized protein (DUF2141 family)